MYFVRLTPVCSLAIVIFFTQPGFMQAQNEIQRERSSLKGIAEMGFSLNVEYPSSLTAHADLQIDSIKIRARRKLKSAGLPVVKEAEMNSSDNISLVYMHINIMDAGRGLVPFSASIRFYQPVRLILNRGIRSSASTWETGMVGIVSYDRVNEIGNSAVDLLQDFIDDYNQVNF